jgi:zinc protease
MKRTSPPSFPSAAGRVTLASALCLLGACAAPSHAAPPIAPVATRAKPKPPPPKPASPPSDGVVRTTLANGLRVVVVPNRLAPVATMEINYMVGSNEVPNGFPGTAHAQEHMMFRGSPGLSADQLADIMASLGGDMNADTQETVTQYFITAPAEDLSVVLHVGATRMAGVNDSEEQWDTERGAIEQEVAADNSNPEYVLYTRLLRALFKGTPYAHDALGTRPSFDQTTAKALKTFHDSWYGPNNAIMIIAGHVDPANVLPEVKQLFGAIPRVRVPARPAVHLTPVVPKTLRMKTDQPYGFVALAFRLPGYASRDFAAAQVLSDILSSERGPLYALVPEGKALAAGFQNNLFPETGLGFAYAVFPKGADTEALSKTLRKALSDAVKQGFSADLVTAAKRDEATGTELEKNSVSGLAQAWSNALAVEGRQSPEDDVRAMKSVTAAEVDAVARRYLDLGHALEAVLTPQPSGAPIVSKGFGGAENFAPSKTLKVTLPDWAAKALGELAIPKSAVNPTETILPNGLRLIVQPESVSDTVSVFGEIKHQAKLETPKGQDGVEQVLGRLFDFGTTTMDRVAFQKALDDIGAEESAGTHFHIQALAEHFDRAVQLLADNELHPALPAQAFGIVQGQISRAVAGRNHSPDYLTQRAISVNLVPWGDPQRRQATARTVARLTLADVQAYYRHVYRPDLTTLVVIGKIDPATAKQVVIKYFGGWAASGKRPVTDLPKIPPNSATRTTVPDRSRKQDKVTLAETLGLTRTNPDYYALELGNHVLGGGFYATKLYHDLREQSGLVYYVHSTFDVKRTRATYTLAYGCDPPNVAKARAIAVRDLNEMRKAPVSADQLQQAKGILLRDIPLHESSVTSIAGGLIQRSLEGLPLDEPTLAAHRYMTLDAKAVQAAFAKWLAPARLIQVVQGPAPK